MGESGAAVAWLTLAAPPPPCRAGEEGGDGYIVLPVPHKSALPNMTAPVLSPVSLPQARDFTTAVSESTTPPQVKNSLTVGGAAAAANIAEAHPLERPLQPSFHNLRDQFRKRKVQKGQPILSGMVQAEGAHAGRTGQRECGDTQWGCV